ncbi:MAG: hypothetical protein HY731_10600 [Candidatus Tectomicrobia bacterium]|nr:hypothetical protein [Candidatus Tectomicrobia bacterium]
MNRFRPLTIFTIAMAYLEAAVVVYLRELYYPEGFDFPLKMTPTHITLIEIGREFTTIVMLVAVGMLAGFSRWQKFAYFMYAFGLWDIFYYVWLKVLLNWPPSLFTWDVLFLIPLPWLGPVYAPMIVALTLILAGIIIAHREERGFHLHFTKLDWAWEVLAGFIIILSFIWNYPKTAHQEVPENYLWQLLLLGEVIGMLVFLRALGRSVVKADGRKSD